MMVLFPVRMGLIISKRDGGCGRIGFNGFIFSLGGSWTLRMVRSEFSIYTYEDFFNFN